MTGERQLEGLVTQLRAALPDQLTSVILYGSAAVGDGSQRSDLNILCVVKQLRTAELSACNPVFVEWRASGHPAPLLLTEEELRHSTDCFSIEFSDMREQRRVLFGPDLIANLDIDFRFYRAQVEHELRTKLIRLRQKAADLFSDPAKLALLMADSLSTFCVLGRHALVLSGRQPRFRKAEILAELGQVLNRAMDASNAILAFRSNDKMAAAPAFEPYLEEMESLVRFVDSLDR